jgi:peroxiredoxin
MEIKRRQNIILNITNLKMKKIVLFTLSIAFLSSCAKEKSIEERYLYEGDKIVDVETGDEYIMEEDQQITIIHTDGTMELVAVDETPFYGSALSDEYIKSLEAKLAERKGKLLEEKKNQLKEVRRSRYANISDDELLKQFKQAHSDGLDMSRQMDMIAELVDRGIVNTEEAPGLLEISPELIDLDIEIDKLEDN